MEDDRLEIMELRREIERLRSENADLLVRLDASPAANAPTVPQQLRPATVVAWEPELFHEASLDFDGPPLDARSAPAAKIARFRTLFAGRSDVYAVRWENTRTGKAGWSPAVAGGWANARRPDREYLPPTDAVLEAHLTGTFHVGVYPLLRDDTCHFLAADFDGRTWSLDAAAYADAARD
ncbi:MAG: hypothetical protein WCK58_09135, partial [Chloroflexota bacterium]